MADAASLSSAVAASRGMEAFDNYYCQRYGEERWSSLREAMLKPVNHVAVPNPWVPRARHMLGYALSQRSYKARQQRRDEREQAIQAGAEVVPEDELQPIEDLSLNSLDLHADLPAFALAGGEGMASHFRQWPKPPRDDNSGLHNYYLLDAASILAPLALEPQEGERVLDMCAAPGGKSLILHFLLNAQRKRAEEAAEAGNGDADGDVDSDREYADPGLNRGYDSDGLCIGFAPEEDPTAPLPADAYELPRMPQQEGMDDQDTRSWAFRAPTLQEMRREQLAGVSEGYDKLSLEEIAKKEEEEGFELEDIIQARTVVVSNDVSKDRVKRLEKVLKEYLPLDVRLERGRMTQADGTSRDFRRRYANSFHRVLLDAPCSTDRHVLCDPAELQQWTRERIKSGADRQYELLKTAIETCMPGGRIVYSTCSLSPRENDKLVDRFLPGKGKGKRKGRASRAPFRVITHRKNIVDMFPFGEATRHGIMVLPDKSPYGPLYICVLQKTVEL